MGLGKTIQAIGTAVLKKDLFGFKKTLVVCPALLKHQWKTEIEKFSSEKAVVIQGTVITSYSIHYTKLYEHTIKIHIQNNILVWINSGT